MENQNLLMNLEAYIISLIFSFLIFDACDFTSFGKLLMVWERRQPRSHVKDVLERLTWDPLYEFHQHQMEITRDQFHGFIAYSVRNNVQHAMYYDSTEKLFRNINVQHHLGVLSTLSGIYFPSYFSFLVFKAIYIPEELELTAQQMVEIVNTLGLRRRVEDLMNFLADIYTNVVVDDSILPIYKFCPNARNKEPFYQIDGPPLHIDLWKSLCDKTVEENPYTVGGILGEGLGMEHIWKAACPYCTLQLIVYKILLNIPLYYNR